MEQNRSDKKPLGPMLSRYGMRGSVAEPLLYDKCTLNEGLCLIAISEEAGLAGVCLYDFKYPQNLLNQERTVKKALARGLGGE